MMKMFQGDAMRHPTLSHSQTHAHAHMLTHSLTQIATAASPSECLFQLRNVWRTMLLEFVVECDTRLSPFPSPSPSTAPSRPSVDLFNVLFIKIKEMLKERKLTNLSESERQRRTCNNKLLAHQIEQLEVETSARSRRVVDY